MVSVLTQIFLLAAALSADIFAVGFTYGAGGIRLSPAAAFLLTGIPAVILTLSMGLGGAAGSYFPEIRGADVRGRDTGRPRRLEPAGSLRP